MSNLGIGVMIHMLGGNEETVAAHKSAVGKKIASLDVEDNKLKIVFEDGSGIQIYDDGQSCCERRYMNCDDNLEGFVGAEFIEARIADGDTTREDYETKESQFLIVKTSLGEFTVANYNEHNGYYGGFWMVIREIQQ